MSRSYLGLIWGKKLLQSIGVLLSTLIKSCQFQGLNVVCILTVFSILLSANLFPGMNISLFTRFLIHFFNNCYFICMFSC